MNEQQIQALIDASVSRALAAKDQEISEAIAFALRTYADRPVGEKGSPSLQYGVVDSVESTWAMVLLDGQTDAVPINMLGGLVIGERVAVLLVPPSGNLAIGMVTPAVVPPVTPGGDGLVVGHDSFLDTVGVDIGNGGKLQWVLDTGFAIGIAPNAGLFDLTDPERPVVLADGYLTFDMNVQGDTEDEPNQRIQWVLVRGSSSLLFGEQGFPTTAANSESNAITFSFSYPCLAGDQVLVQLQTASGSTRHYSMFGSVKLVESLGEATPASGGFPVGPLDDGVATYLLGEPSPLPAGGISGMLLSGLSDANGGEAQLAIGFLGSGIAASASMQSSTQDGSEAQIGAVTTDATSAVVQLTVQANGGASGFFEVGSLASGASSVFATAGRIELVADSSHLLLQGPEIQFAGALTDPTISTSTFALWLDDTPGATILHIKAKDSGGTVRTASIPLL